MADTWTAMNRRTALAMLAALPLAASPLRPARSASNLILSTGMREPWTMPDKSGCTDLLVAEALGRLDLAADVVVNLAASRALQLANDGIDDGLTARVAGLEAKYPNLLRVPEPIFENDFVACSLDLALKTPDWSSLAPYSVAHIIGWQVFQNNLPPVRQLTQAKDSTQMFTLLRTGRVEIILHERWQALWHARELGMEITVHEPPLARVPMYMYLHSRHAALVPPLAAALAAMKRDGTHDHLTERAFAGLKSRSGPPDRGTP